MGVDRGKEEAVHAVHSYQNHSATEGIAPGRDGGAKQIRDDRDIEKGVEQTGDDRDKREGSATKTSSAPSRLQTIMIGSIVPLVLLILWELLSKQGVVPANQLPAPSTVLGAITDMVRDGSLWGHVGITLYRVFIGFLVGTGIALVLGVFVGFYRLLEQLMDPLLQAFRSIPSLAWVPLFLLWMGISEASKVTLIAVGVFFPVYLSIVSGIQGVDRKLIEVGQVHGLNNWQIIRRIVLPAALPSFLVGIRGGLGLGWMFVVAAELLGASEGLGFLLVFGQNTSAPHVIIASIVLFAILGKLTDAVLKRVENRSLHWQDRYSS